MSPAKLNPLDGNVDQSENDHRGPQRHHPAVLVADREGEKSHRADGHGEVGDEPRPMEPDRAAGLFHMRSPDVGGWC